MINIEIPTPSEFKAQVFALFRGREALHNTLLELADKAVRLHSALPVVCMLGYRATQPRGAAILAANGDLEVADLRLEDEAAWRQFIAGVGYPLKRIRGPKASVEMVLRRERMKSPSRTYTAYGAHSYVVVEGAIGNFRTANTSDSGLVELWLKRFLLETRQSGGPWVAPAVAKLIAEEAIFLLIGNDGKPTAMTAVVARFEGIIRLSLVYTPQSKRRQGFARQCVGFTTNSMLRSGATTCCLHADPVSDLGARLYGKLGFQEFGEILDVTCA